MPSSTMSMSSLSLRSPDGVSSQRQMCRCSSVGSSEKREKDTEVVMVVIVVSINWRCAKLKVLMEDLFQEK